MGHNMTVTVEEPLWEEMRKHSEIRWSVVMKDAVKERIKALEVLNKVMKKSKLSEEEIKKFALDLGKKINR